MEHPNKLYVCKWSGIDSYLKKDDTDSMFAIVVAASNSKVARQYVKEKIGIDVKPTWLMNAIYPTIYIQDGSKPEPIQAKILYNANHHVKIYIQ